MDKDGSPVSAERNSDGTISRFVAEKEWTPTASELATLAGSWYSDEADATFTLVIENGKASLRQRPARDLALTPLYKDHFLVQGGYVVWCDRDPKGNVSRIHVGAPRMRDMLFEKVAAKK